MSSVDSSGLKATKLSKTAVTQVSKGSSKQTCEHVPKMWKTPCLSDSSASFRRFKLSTSSSSIEFSSYSIRLGVGTPIGQSRKIQTHQALHENLQRLLPFALLFFAFYFVSDIFICKFMDDFNDVNDDVCVLVAEKSYQSSDCAGRDEFWVRDYRSLRERKESFECQVEVGFRVNESR